MLLPTSTRVAEDEDGVGVGEMAEDGDDALVANAVSTVKPTDLLLPLRPFLEEKLPIRKICFQECAEGDEGEGRDG